MSAWANPQYGDFVLCASFILASVAVALLRYYDRWQSEHAAYLDRWHKGEKR